MLTEGEIVWSLVNSWEGRVWWEALGKAIHSVLNRLIAIYTWSIKADDSFTFAGAEDDGDVERVVGGNKGNARLTTGGEVKEVDEDIVCC